MCAGDEIQHLDPVVAAVMHQLTEWTCRRYHGVHRRHRTVPLRLKGLRDPSSRSGTIHLAKNLKHHGFDLDPEQLRNRAIGHGWKASDARDLRDVAEGVRSGRRYHTVGDPFGYSAIDRWREVAAEVG